MERVPTPLNGFPASINDPKNQELDLQKVRPLRVLQTAPSYKRRPSRLQRSQLKGRHRGSASRIKMDVVRPVRAIQRVGISARPNPGPVVYRRRLGVCHIQRR